MPSSHFSKIAVLQSLPPGEIQTGKRLCEDVEILNLFHERGLNISFHDVVTKPQFFACLAALQLEATQGKWPLLHIECHGANDKTGIILADSSFLGWEELKPYLTSLNMATQCNLMIVLATCYGGYLAQIMLPTDRAPCWGMIGPTDKVFPHELLSSYVSFYTELLASLDGDNSLNALMHSPLKTGGYYFTTAGGFFKRAYANYFLNYCTPSELEKRAKGMSRKLKNAPSTVRASKGALKRLLKKTEQQSFDKFSQQFFMIDLFPENKERFPISLEDVKQHGATKLKSYIYRSITSNNRKKKSILRQV